MYPTGGPPNVTQAILNTAENLQKGIKIVEEMKRHVLKKRAAPEERTRLGDFNVSLKLTGEPLRKFCSTGKPHNWYNKMPMTLACVALEKDEESVDAPSNLLDFCESSKKDKTPVEKEFCSLVLTDETQGQVDGAKREKKDGMLKKQDGVTPKKTDVTQSRRDGVTPKKTDVTQSGRGGVTPKKTDVTQSGRGGVTLKKNGHWGAVASVCCCVFFGIVLVVFYFLLRVRGDSDSQPAVTYTRGASTP